MPLFSGTDYFVHMVPGQQGEARAWQGTELKKEGSGRKKPSKVGTKISAWFGGF
jgi:hypothetical protein